MNVKHSGFGRALAVTAAFLLLGAACTDPTVEPKSTVTDANVFNDPSSYQLFIARVYSGLSVSGQQGPSGLPDISGIDEGFSQYLRLYWEMEELPTDEAVIGWGDIGLPEMNTGLWNSQSNMVVAMYYRVYFQAMMANEFLRQTTDQKLAARGQSSNAALVASIKQYRAEARFLRALSYAHGLDLFGGIPIVTEANPVGGTPPKQNTRTEVYNFVVSELKAVKADLPLPGPSTYGRATWAAANMLLANLYLNAGVYIGTADNNNAWIQADSVIGSGLYSLNSNYLNNFKADNNTSPEIIFPITFDGLRTETWGGTTFLVHAACGGGDGVKDSIVSIDSTVTPFDTTKDTLYVTYGMDATAYGIDGCWWGTRLKTEAATKFYGSGDTRYSYFHLLSVNGAPPGTPNDTVGAVGNWNTGWAAPKFSNVTSGGASGSHKTFPDTDFPLYRLAEAYLIRAEAALRGAAGGSAAQALADVNLVRERAYGGASGDIAAVTIDTILAERGREFLLEAKRRTDLVRFGLFTGGTYVWSWKGGDPNGVSLASFRDLYPLPANELIANPNLTQNPGY